MAELLGSWRPGPARDAIMAFLDASAEVPDEERVAVIDYDGTLCCERPANAQLAFIQHEIKAAVAADPTLAQRTDYRLMLEPDPSLSVLGLRRVVMSVGELFANIGPQQFTERVRQFRASAIHPDFRVPYRDLVYQPMLEMMDALRSRRFAVFITTLGEVEFVRAYSQHEFGVPPEGVVGTAVGYSCELHDGRPMLVRTDQLLTELNEGPTVVINVQVLLGRRPILAAGNSVADRTLLEYARTSDRPSLALLIDHDDDQREYAYRGEAFSISETEPIVDVGRQLGWTVVSMRDDWATVFTPEVRR